MKKMVLFSLQSVKKQINPRARKYAFEIFGYDFIIDADFHVWLIEVNTNPCLDESSALLKQLLPRMVDDALKLTVDQVFPPKGEPDKLQTSIVVPLPNKNLWEHVSTITI